LHEGGEMVFDITKLKGREPLQEYPWRNELDRLFEWLSTQENHVTALCFDLIMSAAYIDASSGIEKNIEQCDNTPSPFNAHIGFINLCSPCYINAATWSYQKAVKPQSGALGKLSSEIILRFIEKLHPHFTEVIAVGGTDAADAVLKHNSGITILAEVKSAPLLTYPFIFEVPDGCLNGQHEKLTITTSQLQECRSAIHLHNEHYIDLGKVGDHLWPFKPLVDFIINPTNKGVVDKCINNWLDAKNAYTAKDRGDRMYYLANASGGPPKIAKDRDLWPSKESISDSKTSAGMDRTDDIKKGIYQSIKIGTTFGADTMLKTAIISNLPAGRHGDEYVAPFENMFWGLEENLNEIGGEQAIKLTDLRRVFDYIITLDDPILRDLEL
jgi:hypothetical protein